MIKMIKFRDLENSEIELLKNFLGYYGESIYNKLTKPNRFLIGDGNKKEFFLISQELYNIYLKIKELKTPYYLGNYFGELKGNKFLFSLNSLKLLIKFTNKKIQVNKKGEIRYIYGKDLKSNHISQIFSNFNSYEKVIVINYKMEVLGLGLTLNPIKKEFNKNIKIKNILDLGWYLRKGN